MVKGSHQSESAKEKIRQYRLGKKWSDEVKARMSLSHTKEFTYYNNGSLEIKVYKGSYIPKGFKRGRLHAS